MTSLDIVATGLNTFEISGCLLYGKEQAITNQRSFFAARSSTLGAVAIIAVHNALFDTALMAGSVIVLYNAHNFFLGTLILAALVGRNAIKVAVVAAGRFAFADSAAAGR